MIEVDGNGVQTCIDDNDPSRTLAVAGDAPDRDQQIAAFFAANPPPPPDSVSMRQARLALNVAGLLTQIDAAVQAADAATQINWEYASAVERTNSLVATVAAGLGLTSDQIDDLFRQAATL